MYPHANYNDLAFNIILLYLLVSLAMKRPSQLPKVSLLMHNSVYVQLFCGFITKPLMFQIYSTSHSHSP